MATRKSDTEVQLTKQVKKKARKTVKTMNTGILMISVLFLVVGVAIGSYSAAALTENDCFALLGPKEITIKVNDSFNYQDEGVKIVSFGRDISNQVVINTSLPKDEQGKYIVDTSTPGIYTITYTVNDIKYGHIQRIRSIRILGGEA